MSIGCLPRLLVVLEDGHRIQAPRLHMASDARKTLKSSPNTSQTKIINPCDQGFWWTSAQHTNISSQPSCEPLPTEPAAEMSNSELAIDTSTTSVTRHSHIDPYQQLLRKRFSLIQQTCITTCRPTKDANSEFLGYMKRSNKQTRKGQHDHINHICDAVRASTVCSIMVHDKLPTGTPPAFCKIFSSCSWRGTCKDLGFACFLYQRKSKHQITKLKETPI